MATIKKINIAVALFLVIFIPLSVFADATKIDNPLSDADSLSEFFDKIIDVVLQLGTILSVLGIMYGGFLYVTAQGNEEQLGKAYKTITWALVGTAVLLGSRVIMTAVVETVSTLGE